SESPSRRGLLRDARGGGGGGRAAGARHRDAIWVVRRPDRRGGPGHAGQWRAAVVRAGAVPRAAGRADRRPGADRPGDRSPPPIRRWTPGAGSRPDDDRPVARGRTAGLRARGSVTEASEGVAARPAVRPLVAWSVLAVASVG